NGKSDVSKETREELYVPPVYTKSWYHTGAYIEAGVLSKQYEKEYYQKDGKAFRLPDSAFEPIPAEEDAENYRQAWRALKGRLLRSEIYAADQKPESDHPYTVEETNYRVKQYQPLQSKGYAVFYVHENEALTYDYERNPDDPRMQHSFTLEVDDYGNVLNSCTVYYPRRLPPAEPASANPADRIYDEQMQLKATAELDRFGNITTDDCWLIGVICEKMSLELGGLDLQGEAYFSFDRIKVQLNEALNHRIRYDEDFSQGSKQSRPFTWERYYYWDLELDAALPLGAVNALALPHHIEQAVFTPQLIDNVFGGKVSEEMLSGDGGYTFKDGYWWNGGLTQSYYQEGFYQPWKTEGPGSGITALDYDKYWLCP
ncbi:MAG TPA: sugar-binding protein, partial [Pelotomaculum sp.]|nr:sugar-binding protein [Pelotomaculum sp.]